MASIVISKFLHCTILVTIELSVKYSKESTKTLCLLKTENKVVEVGWIHNKVEDNNNMMKGPQWEANWVPLLNR
jgi:hypothetical protein